MSLLLLVPAVVAQNNANPRKSWILYNRVVMTGSSDHSDPEGYMVYSAITLESGIVREISRSLAAELSIRTGSHEVDIENEDGTKTNLGSIELLPVNLMLRYRIPLWEKVMPCLGAGGHLSIFWEKSGQLDSSDLTPAFGPSLQLGADVVLSSRLLLNFDIKWNRLRTDLEYDGKKAAAFRFDPLFLAVGVGVRL